VIAWIWLGVVGEPDTDLRRDPVRECGAASPTTVRGTVKMPAEVADANEFGGDVVSFGHGCR
jgi:hypothetical protein